MQVVIIKRPESKGRKSKILNCLAFFGVNLIDRGYNLMGTWYIINLTILRRNVRF